MSTIAKALFQMSSWPMRTPVPYSGFHLVFGGAGILAAIFLAWKLSRGRHLHVLSACGLILAVSEIYKQGFLYYIVNGEQYDWWYFPFQLCSIPMYLCLLLPFIGPRMSSPSSKSSIYLPAGLCPVRRRHGAGRTQRTDASVSCINPSRVHMAFYPDFHWTLLCIYR